MTLADNTAALQRLLAQINALPGGEEAAQLSAAEETGGEQTEETAE